MKSNNNQKPDAIEHKLKSLRTAIQNVGAYEENVRVWPDPSDKTTVNYKIDDKLADSIIDRISEAIEHEAGALKFKVLQHI